MTSPLIFAELEYYAMQRACIVQHAHEKVDILLKANKAQQATYSSFIPPWMLKKLKAQIHNYYRQQIHFETVGTP